MIGPISFASPAILAGLIVLPALYFLLRATPPAPRRQIFPPIRLLRDIDPTTRTPIRMPLWLLLLRLLATAMVIVGFAGPQIVPPPLLGGHGPILLAIDNGWGAAQSFPATRAAARRLIDQLGGSGIILLATAGAASGKPPQATGVLTRTEALSAIGALHAQPWPANRAQDRKALATLRRHIANPTTLYLSDGLNQPGLARFITTLDPTRIVTGTPDAIRLLETPRLGPKGSLIARLAIVPQSGRVIQPVLAEAASGAALARTTITIRPGARHGSARFDLPAAIAARVTRLALPGLAAPGATALLDGSARRITVGLLAGGTADPEQHLLGSLYYVRRALPPGTRIRTLPIRRLTTSGVSAIILADEPLDPAAITRLRRFIAAGGVVIRFAGPLTAPKPDALTPDRLLPGIRVLGGALAAGKPETIAGFTRNSPLAGLASPKNTALTPPITIEKQILADPASLDPATVWARLADGTPIVLAARQGRGILVSILTTANTAWSDWPIAAGFPALIDRLIHLGHGAPPKSGILHPLHVLNGVGALVAPGAGARPLDVADLAHITISPVHPPGLWGNKTGAQALNLAGHVPALAAATLPPGIPRIGLDAIPRARIFGPAIIAIALAILIADTLISLVLRGAIRLRTAATALLILASIPPHARAANPALTPRLAFVRTGSRSTDTISRAGLAAITELVDQETAARLAAPSAVTLGRTDLDLYPLLYWPITAATRPPGPAACHALDAFMAGGGLLVIDTDGGGADLAGSGAGFDPGAAAALRHATACLAIPPLQRLTDRDTLTHTFFLTRHFAGRFAGAPVYIAAKGARDADGVSPVVIGSNDWAGAWATDASGMPMRQLLPGDPGQRQNADWFGVNLVMYALTGTYKADQVQIPAILRRLGE